MEQVRKNWFLPVFALIYQIPFVTNTDLDRNRAFMFCVAGAICLFVFCLKLTDWKKALLLLAPLSWFTIATAANWIHGYSLYELVPWYAAIGIILWSANVPRIVVFVTFLVIALTQMLYNHVPIMGEFWSFVQSFGHSYNYGTVRNSIRYGMVILPAATYCFWYMTRLVNRGKIREGFILLPVFALLCYGLYEANARLTTAVAIVAICGFFAAKVKNIFFRVFCGFTAGAGIFALCNPTHLGARASKIWPDGLALLSESAKGTLFGYGAGAWNIFIDSGNAHCEPLNIVVDFGIVGLVIVSVCGFLAVRRAFRGGRVFDAVAFCMFAATSATYILRYWVIFFCFCLLTGQLLRDEA